MISATDLRQMISYTPDTGALCWRPKPCDGGRETRRWNARYAGMPALSSVSTSGYLTGTIQRKHYKAHRVAWALYHGYWPSCEIDHINGDPFDNRISNLRLANRSQNARNRKKRVCGTSAYKGVARDGSKWRATINANCKRINIGSFKNELEAAIGYDLFASALHGEFSKTNFINDRDAITAFVDDYVRRNHKAAVIAGVKVWTQKEAF